MTFSANGEKTLAVSKGWLIGVLVMLVAGLVTLGVPGTAQLQKLLKEDKPAPVARRRFRKQRTFRQSR